MAAASGHPDKSAVFVFPEDNGFFQEDWDWNDDTAEDEHQRKSKSVARPSARRKPTRRNAVVRTNLDVFGADILNMDPWSAEKDWDSKKEFPDNSTCVTTSTFTDSEGTDNSSINDIMVEDDIIPRDNRAITYRIKRSSLRGGEEEGDVVSSAIRKWSSSRDLIGSSSRHRSSDERKSKQRSRSNEPATKTVEKYSRPRLSDDNCSHGTTRSHKSSNSNSSRRKHEHRERSERGRSKSKSKSTMSNKNMETMNKERSVAADFYSHESMKVTLNGKGKTSKKTHRGRSPKLEQKSSTPRRMAKQFFSPGSIKLTITGKPKPREFSSSYLSKEDQTRVYGIESASKARRSSVESSLAALIADFADDINLLGTTTIQRSASFTKETVASAPELLIWSTPYKSRQTMRGVRPGSPLDRTQSQNPSGQSGEESRRRTRRHEQNQ